MDCSTTKYYSSEQDSHTCLQGQLSRALTNWAISSDFVSSSCDMWCEVRLTWRRDLLHPVHRWHTQSLIPHGTCRRRHPDTPADTCPTRHSNSSFIVCTHHQCGTTTERHGFCTVTLYLFVSVLCPANIYGHMRMGTDLWLSLWLYCVAPLGNQATGTMIQYSTQSYYPDTELNSPFPILVVMLSDRLGIGKHQFCTSLVWLGA